MAMNTPYLSEGTGHITSNLTIDGALTVGGVVTYNGGASAFTALSGTSATFSGRVSVGGGSPIVFASGSSTSLVATTAVATKSTETTFTNNNATIGDIVTWGLGTSTSSLSAGLDLTMFVSAASTITIRLSNVSAANAAQPAISLTYKLERMVF